MKYEITKMVFCKPTEPWHINSTFNDTVRNFFSKLSLPSGFLEINFVSFQELSREFSEESKLNLLV